MATPLHNPSFSRPKKDNQPRDKFSRTNTNYLFLGTKTTETKTLRTAHTRCQNKNGLRNNPARLS